MQRTQQKRNERYWLIATIAASVATIGSIYFSEVLGWVPCKYCWIQRIFMYPVAWMLVVSHIRQQAISRVYIVPFVIAGGGLALYHTVIQKINVDPSKTTCQGEVTCYTDYLNLFGWITIPMLALTAFIIIGVCMALIKKDNTSTIETHHRDGTAVS